MTLLKLKFTLYHVLFTAFGSKFTHFLCFFTCYDHIISLLCLDIYALIKNSLRFVVKYLRFRGQIFTLLGSNIYAFYELYLRLLSKIFTPLLSDFYCLTLLLKKNLLFKSLQKRYKNTNKWCSLDFYLLTDFFFD